MATEADYGTNADADVGDLFDYGADLDEVAPPTAANHAVAGNRAAAEGEASGLGLGLDEEAEGQKKRKPIAKLDENR